MVLWRWKESEFIFLGEVFSLPSLSSDLMVPINKIEQGERGQHLCQAFTLETSLTPTGLV